MGVPSRLFHKHSKTRGIFDIPFSTPVKEALGDGWMRNNWKISLREFDRWLSLNHPSVEPSSPKQTIFSHIFSLQKPILCSAASWRFRAASWPKTLSQNRSARKGLTTFSLNCSRGIPSSVTFWCRHISPWHTHRCEWMLQMRLGFASTPRFGPFRARRGGGATERKQTRTGDRSRGRRGRSERAVALHSGSWKLNWAVGN